MVEDGQIIARLFKSKKKEDIYLLIDKMSSQLPAFYFYFFIFNEEFYLFLFCHQKTRQLILILNNNSNSVQEIIKKQRLIRSLNGLFSYVVEMQLQTDLFKFIKSNFPIGFWENVRRIVKRRQKDELKSFLVKCFATGNESAKTYELTNKDLFDDKQRLKHLKRLEHLQHLQHLLTLEMEVLQQRTSETEI
jgi:uncharacterized protein YcgL (UPF0745 family)